MKTLYVSDLDGTLLNSKGKLSENTIETINNLIKNGMHFSYATARSLVSASVVTKGLTINMPVITFNGTFITNPSTGEKLFSLFFAGNQKTIIMDAMERYSVFPLVYGILNNEERVSWLIDRENVGIKKYLNLRKGDKRLRPVSSIDELYAGELFTSIFIGSKEELSDVYRYLDGTKEFACYFQQELYTEEFWCELNSKNASKGNAVLTLKEMLKCDRVITFGDAINDISMFEVSDECYAVENGAGELKQYATGVIKPNDDDGVAHWLKENFRM